MHLIGDQNGNKGGVYWAVVLTGPYDILANVRVSDREWLAEYAVKIQEIEIGGVKAVRSTLTLIEVDFYPIPPGPPPELP